MLFPIIVTVLVGLTILLLANFAKKVNAESNNPKALEASGTGDIAKSSTSSIHEEIKAQAPVEVPTTTAKPKAKKKSAPKKKTTTKVDA